MHLHMLVGVSLRGGRQHRGEGVCGVDGDRWWAAVEERAVLHVNRLCQVGSILCRRAVPDPAVRPALASLVGPTYCKKGPSNS
jgi:hypothetical protein